jgi:class 3 adenylate cyclase/tetratricopeptide (TPR) repeat protein
VSQARSIAAGPTCPSCGTEAPPGARFCPGCGIRLSESGVERRVVTLLFADLVGSTELVEALDPEAARRVLDEVFGQVAAEVRRHGGSLEKYIGDAVLAAFGFPSAHGDDASRAVRAALAIRAAIETATTAIGDVPITLRIGLHTGEVVAADSSVDLRLAGDAIHTAARIQQHAKPGQILISTRTLRAAGHTVRVGPPRQVVARGKHRPVEVVEVVGPGAPEPVAAPLVERNEELIALLTALRAAERQGGMTLLVGEAGVGKSTLARAAVARLPDPVLVLWGNCLPDWQCLPLWPLREVLAAAAGVAPTEPAEVLADAMDRLVADMPAGPDVVRHTTAAMRRLLGLGEMDGPERAGEAGAPELASALHRVLCGLARGRRERVLVVLEDLQWATPDLLDLITFVVGGECPDRGRVAFLGVSRPEPPTEDPAFLEGTRACRVQLGTLPEGPTADLAAALLGADAPRELLGRVFEASQGNPLFTRELALALRETGIAGRRIATLPIPDSLRGLIAARLDRLPPARRLILCQASVIGRSFSPAALAGMAARDEAGVITELEELVATGLLERVGSMPGNDAEYSFHHVLFRDVAYSVLAKESRSELHRRLAEWLAARPRGGFRPDELVAHHLVTAVRLAREVRSPSAADRQLAVGAVVACRRAAERLRDQEALTSAARVLNDAIDMAVLAGTPREDVAELLAHRGAVRGATGDPAGALADLREASTSERSAIRAQAFTELSNLHAELGEYPEAAAAADRALVEARASRSPSLAALALRVTGYAPYLDGRLAETKALLEEAVELARRGDRPRLASELLATLLVVRLHLACPLDEVAADARQLVVSAKASARRLAEASAHYVLGEVGLLQDDLDAADQHFAQAYRHRREVGLSFRRLLWPMIGLTATAVESGDTGLARSRAEEALALTTQPGQPPEPEADASLALAALAAGDLLTADAALKRAGCHLRDTDVLGRAEVLRAESRLAVAKGRHDTAIRLLKASLACLEDRDYRLDRLRVQVDLVTVLGRTGRPALGPLAISALYEAGGIQAHALVRTLGAAS